MGADIHGYIVYKDWERNGEQHYTEFSSGQLHISRNYVLFNALAGVRAWEESEPPLFPPRGISPLLKGDRLGIWNVFEDCWLKVVDDATYEKWKDNESFHYTNRENADKWAQSKWNPQQTYIIPPVQRSDGRWTESREYVSHPDWHSHSWLYAYELDQVLEKMGQTLVPAGSWSGNRAPNDLPVGEHRIPLDQFESFDRYYADKAVDEQGLVRVSIKRSSRGLGLLDNFSYDVEIGDRKPIGIPVDMQAVLAAMNAINVAKGDPEASVFIFWFDN